MALYKTKENEMKPCKCFSCSLSRAVSDGKIKQSVVDAIMLGYHYYGMTHTKNDDDAGWHAEGVDFYRKQLNIKTLNTIIKKAKE